MSDVNYHIDGINIKQYDVFVSSSDGLLSLPKLKKPVSLSWETEHGESVDVSKRYYEAREIQLDCFIKAESEADFIKKCNAFLSLFFVPGLRRLSVSVDSSEPILFEVYCDTEINIKKKWSSNTMVGTFSLKLKEPEPVKRVYKYQYTVGVSSPVRFKIDSSKNVNIYWGDKKKTSDANSSISVDKNKILLSDKLYNSIGVIVAFDTQSQFYWVALKSDGTTETSTSGAITDYIDVSKAYSIHYSGNLIQTSNICFYDEGKNFISSFSHTGTLNEIDIVIPQGVHYIRASHRFDSAFKTCKIYSNDIVHTYDASGIYYILLTGDIDSITATKTTANLVWNRL